MHLICDTCHNKIFLNDADRHADSFRCHLCGHVIPSERFKLLNADRMLWVKRKNGRIVGPITYERLHKMIFTRRVFAGDTASFEGRDGPFARLGDIAELSSIFTAQGPTGNASSTGGAIMIDDDRQTALPTDDLDELTEEPGEPTWAEESSVKQTAEPEMQRPKEPPAKTEGGATHPTPAHTASKTTVPRQAVDAKSVLTAIALVVIFIGIMLLVLNLGAVRTALFSRTEPPPRTAGQPPPALPPPPPQTSLRPPPAAAPEKVYTEKDVDQALTDPNATREEKVARITTIADYYIDRKKFMEAVASLKKAFGFGLIDAKLYKLLVYVYRRQGLEQTAIDALKNALQYAPNDPDITLELAVSYRRTKDYVSEKELLLHYLENNRNPAFSERLGDLMRLQQRFIEAESYYDDALKQSTTDEDRARITGKIKQMQTGLR